MKKYLNSIAIIIATIFIISPAFSVHAQTSTENMLIVFDASGSMTESFGGSPRIDVAKSVISDLLGSLDSNTLVGLRALAQEKKSVKADACIVTSLLQPFTGDHTAVLNQVNSLQAVGSYTPLAYTLQQSASDFTAGANNVLILMTDGQENCGGNPSAVAAALKAAGINVKTYVIGLGATSAMRTDLTAIATAGGGKYYDATDAASLAASFNAIQQAEHPIDKTNTDSLLGTSVTGGNGYQTAVPITSGMYHLSHYQLPSRYDYFKMNVKEGDIISYSITSAEEGVTYIPATNSFKVGTHHYGDYAQISMYSGLRTKLDSIYSQSSSGLSKGSYTVDADSAGIIYFLVGNNASTDQYDSVMSKEDLFTIKVTSPTPSNAPDATSATGANSANTNSFDSNTNNSGSSVGQVGNSAAQSIDQVSSGVSSIFWTIVWIIIGAGILFVVIVILIIVLVVKHNKKKVINPTTNPVTPSVASITTSTTAPASPITQTPPVPPTPPVTPQL